MHTYKRVCTDIFIYFIKFQVQENLYKVISKDTLERK